jgi:hypothetical protein
MAELLTAEEIRQYFNSNHISAGDIEKGTGLNSSGMDRFLKTPDRGISNKSQKILTKWIENDCNASDISLEKKVRVLKKITNIIMNEL